MLFGFAAVSPGNTTTHFGKPLYACTQAVYNENAKFPPCRSEVLFAAPGGFATTRRVVVRAERRRDEKDSNSPCCKASYHGWKASVGGKVFAGIKSAIRRRRWCLLRHDTRVADDSNRSCGDIGRGIFRPGRRR
jgi:hypothetical protein